MTTLATLRKELVVLWASPVPWVAGALFHLLWGALYITELEARGQALFQPAVPLAAFLLLVLVPVVAMRAVAEETRHGTLFVLLASRVSATSVVVGKWLAVVATAGALVAPAAVPLAVIERHGNLDPGGVLAAAFGLLLFAAAVSALAVAASAATGSVALSAAAALLVGLMLWFAAATPGSAGAGGVLARVSLSERLATFASGGIDTGDVVYFVAVALVAVGIASALVARRRARPRSGTALVGHVAAAVGLGALIVVSAAGVVIGDANRRLLDLTTGSSLTLSDTTRAVVDTVSSPVSVTAYAAREDPARVAVGSLLGRYRTLNPRIRFSVASPESASVELRRLGVDPVFGGIVVRQGARIEVAATATEQDITAALARVLRDTVPVVCFTAGHGEAAITDTTDTGLSRFDDLLRSGGHRTRTVNLLASPMVPSACAAIVVAGPSSVPSSQVARAMANWLGDGGRALVLTDPAVEIDWSPLLGQLGIAVDRGIVFELDADHRFPDDPTRPIVLEYRTAHPIGRRLPPTFYPGAQALVVDAAPGPGVTAEAVARTTERSFLERSPLDPSFDEGVDLRGPVTLVAAADRSESADDGVVRSRVVVTADADIATNAFIGEAGNAQLMVRSLDWLTQDPDVVSVTANVPPLRPLDLTAGRVRYLRMLTMAVVPGVFLLAGALGWVLRRVR